MQVQVKNTGLLRAALAAVTPQELERVMQQAMNETLRSMSSADLQPWRLQTLKEQLVDCVGQLVMDQPAEAEHLLQDVLTAIDRAGLALVARPA